VLGYGQRARQRSAIDHRVVQFGLPPLRQPPGRTGLHPDGETPADRLRRADCAISLQNPRRRREVDALQLLPVVKAYCAGRPGKFSRAQNEAHIYEALSDETRAVAARSWQGLEADLFVAMSGAPDRRMRDAIFDLLVRGRELFINQPVRHRTSLTRLLDRALAAADGAPVPALRDLGSLAASLFPAPDLARLRFKSGVYGVAHLGRDHHPTIKEEFIKYLMQEAPAVMRSLPGFKAARSERVGNLKVPIREETSPLVHKLVMRDALAPFEFLSVRQNNDQPAAEENQPATRREPQPA
jgi:hypothetical protein